jgi:hypothetical protein
MRVLIGAPVQQDETVFKYYLESLANQQHDYEVDYFFILHNSPQLKQYLKRHQYEEYSNDTTYQKDNTHVWKNNNLRDVASMKNFLLKKTLDEGYDYFFLVDSDIMLHPKTLSHLVAQQKHICSEIFWTRWRSDEEEMPNAWEHDYYSYTKLGIWNKWRKKGLYEVGYSGACILIHRDVIASGVNYSPLHNVSFSNWEDRAFCIRAAAHGYRIYMDTHYPATHLYRDEDVKRYGLRRKT